MRKLRTEFVKGITFNFEDNKTVTVDEVNSLITSKIGSSDKTTDAIVACVSCNGKVGGSVEEREGLVGEFIELSLMKSLVSVKMETIDNDGITFKIKEEDNKPQSIFVPNVNHHLPVILFTVGISENVAKALSSVHREVYESITDYCKAVSDALLSERF